MREGNAFYPFKDHNPKPVNNFHNICELKGMKFLDKGKITALAGSIMQQFTGLNGNLQASDLILLGPLLLQLLLHELQHLEVGLDAIVVRYCYIGRVIIVPCPMVGA